MENHNDRFFLLTLRLVTADTLVFIIVLRLCFSRCAQNMDSVGEHLNPLVFSTRTCTCNKKIIRQNSQTGSKWKLKVKEWDFALELLFQPIQMKKKKQENAKITPTCLKMSTPKKYSCIYIERLLPESLRQTKCHLEKWKKINQAIFTTSFSWCWKFHS